MNNSRFNFFPEFPPDSRKPPINNFPNFTRIVHVPLLFLSQKYYAKHVHKYRIKYTHTHTHFSQKEKEFFRRIILVHSFHSFTSDNRRPEINSIPSICSLFLQPPGTTLIFQRIRKILSHSWIKGNISKTRRGRYPEC